MKTIQTKKVSKKWLDNELKSLGYRISKTNSFNYYNGYNDFKYEARACYIVEIDSGLSFANVNARRDINFKALQEFRYNNSYLEIKGRIYEI